MKQLLIEVHPIAIKAAWFEEDKPVARESYVGWSYLLWIMNAFPQHQIKIRGLA